MTALIERVSYQVVQTPLNQNQVDDYEYDYDYIQPFYRPQLPADKLNQRMMIILIVVMGLVFTAVVTITVPRLLKLDNSPPAVALETTTQKEMTNSEVETAVAVVSGGISPVFSPQIQHWAPQIIAWAAQYGLDPDIAATIMQIESCGDPQAVSHAGAQGLFQVMPFHFTAGEVMLDPETNAARGLAYYSERLKQTGGDIFQAFAGYNGGHVAAAGSWNSWANETQRYYTWSKGIYEDAKSGATTSPTLQQWFQAGGASLCQQASNRLNLN
jgi:hypothetical protein